MRGYKLKLTEGGQVFLFADQGVGVSHLNFLREIKILMTSC